MEETAADIANGAVDPETLYTKQNCIGMLPVTCRKTVSS